MLTVAYDVKEQTLLSFEPATTGVLSWNTQSPGGKIEFRLLGGGFGGNWLPYAEWNSQGRRSFSAVEEDVFVETDVVRSREPFTGIEVRAPGVFFEMIAFATPPANDSAAPQKPEPLELDVPQRTQFVVEDERGWCSPASLSMLHAFHGVDRDVPTTACSVFDQAYNGTGNWAFNMAFSGSLGLRGAVVYLRDFAHARELLANGIPIALSYSWKENELPSAPVQHSDGHLGVLRGFDRNGDPVMNDPAAPSIRTVYPRENLERIWLRSGGIAYVVAPRGKDFVSIVNQ